MSSNFCAKSWRLMGLVGAWDAILSEDDEDTSEPGAGESASSLEGRDEVETARGVGGTDGGVGGWLVGVGTEARDLRNGRPTNVGWYIVREGLCGGGGGEEEGETSSSREKMGEGERDR